MWVIRKDFEGTLLSDGYSAYASYAEQKEAVIHAQCWVHTRRYFDKAKNIEPVASVWALELIGLLYQHEKTITQRQYQGAEKQQYRTEQNNLALSTI